LAVVTLVFAIAACSDAPSPLGLGATDENGVVAPEAHFTGKNHDLCVEDEHEKGRGHHWDHGRKYGHLHHCDQHHPKPQHDKDDHKDHGDCDHGSGNPAPGSVAGTVKNNNQPVTGYPIFLLSPNGATVIATTNTIAGGTYTFTGVKPGAYLVCEADPFVEQWGMLAETTPQTGPSCTGDAYAPVGYSVTVPAGGTSGGNDFANFGLE
jgi:hypothetical protein